MLLFMLTMHTSAMLLKTADISSKVEMPKVDRHRQICLLSDPHMICIASDTYGFPLHKRSPIPLLCTCTSKCAEMHDCLLS